MTNAHYFTISRLLPIFLSQQDGTIRAYSRSLSGKANNCVFGIAGRYSRIRADNCDRLE